MKIDRLLTIIVMLLNRDRISAKELADKFEVSIRTIYRDIDSINMAGIPIISYPGNLGGFGIMENYKLNHQLLTLDNLCSMLSVLSDVNASLGNKELDASIEKLKNLVPKEQASDFDRLLDQMIIEVQPWEISEKVKGYVKDIRYAISRNHQIRIKYRNYSNDVSVRTVEPMSLVFRGYAWYVFGYCRLKEDYRLFRLSRIIEVEIEQQIFIRRDGSYTDKERFVDDMFEVKLKFDAEVRTRVEDVFPKDSISIQDNGDLIVDTVFNKGEKNFGLILSFGEYVEVLEPKRLRDSFANRTSKMYKKYFRDEP